ncbi:hypothetical protein U1Q18_013135 [Sarracenia purpurea var. burkii]
MNPNPNPQFPPFLLSPLRTAITTSFTTIENLRLLSATRCCSSSSMADGEAHAPPSPSSALEQQFEDFRHHLYESGSLRERIRGVATEIESATRFQCHIEILEKAEAQIGMLKELFHRLAEILLECPGQYYR